jgi:hypothetical protein
MVYLPLNILAQQTNDKIHYTTSKKYSSNVVSTFFEGYDNFTIAGTTQSLQKKFGINPKKTEIESDNTKDSISIRENPEKILICLYLVDDTKRIIINVYNMLAKKVLDVYDGLPVKDEDCPDQYSIVKAKLPNGVYLCVVTGDKFRLVGKFIISR